MCELPNISAAEMNPRVGNQQYLVTYSRAYVFHKRRNIRDSV